MDGFSAAELQEFSAADDAGEVKHARPLPVPAFDPGITTQYHRTDTGVIVNRLQDCEPHLDQAKRSSNEGDWGPRDMQCLAEWPPVVVEIYCNRNGITFEEWMRDPYHAKTMARDRALSGFRVRPGSV